MVARPVVTLTDDDLRVIEAALAYAAEVWDEVAEIGDEYDLMAGSAVHLLDRIWYARVGRKPIRAIPRGS